jgi:hypothetical protein
LLETRLPNGAFPDHVRKNEFIARTSLSIHIPFNISSGASLKDVGLSGFRNLGNISNCKETSGVLVNGFAEILDDTCVILLPVISPDKILLVVGTCEPRFMVKVQHNSQELLLFLLS